MTTLPPRLQRALIPLAFWVGGMLLAHGSMIGSGLARVQGNRGVPRMLHVLLEHDYRWMTGDPLHASFWDPPFFHPAKNVAAYSETLVGVAPVYAALRRVGVPLDLAFPLWLLLMSTLNFACAYLCFRDALGRTPVAAAFGAFLFAFASMRIAYMGLPQLLPGFYIVLVVHALLRLLREEDPRRRAAWLALFAAAWVGQAYTCFYVAWFLGLALGAGLLWALLLPSVRPAALPVLRRNAAGLLAAGVAIVLCLIPFLRHSLQAAAAVGYRDYDEVEMYLPQLQSWLHFGSEHWLYGWAATAWPFSLMPTRAAEQSIGLGLASTALAVAGFWSMRSTTIGRLSIAVTLTLALITLRLPGGPSLWSVVYLVVPGAKAVRAVARVSTLILLPVAAAGAAGIDGSRWRKPLLIAATLFSLLEQGRSMPTYDRREDRDSSAALAARIDRHAEAFWYSTDRAPADHGFLDSMAFRFHVDAMMAGTIAGVPTVNGYSGWNPPGWPMEGDTLAPTPEAEKTVEKDLQAWCERNGIPRDRIQWIKPGR